ncbi:MAG: TM0106 family RecB-like putative nuclease [Ornithinibacter sp.]
MFLLDDRRLVISASDLRTAATCEFALVAELDVRLGRRERVVVGDDPMLARVKELGDQHEQAELRRLSRAHPGGVVQLNRPVYTEAGLRRAMEQTLGALRSQADVIFQATFFDGGFVGHSDFIERTPRGWLVSDTKLARSASVPALLQIAAYAAMLQSCGVPTAPVARLVLGNGDARDHDLSDILPVYRSRRTRLDALLAEHRADAGPATWGDERWLACGRCEVCEPDVVAARDLLMVAGMRVPTRRRFLEAGVRTVEELSTRTDPVPDVRAATLERLSGQARLQLVQERGGEVVAEVVDEVALRRLPAPSPGDIFFDFEGDPLWAESGSNVWGLEYLFGIVEVDRGEPDFRTFWAHDREQERQALVDFVGYLADRRARWPGLHVYHYAPYEPSALLRLAARHGVCEDDVDQLLREGVFVDLYATVRAGIRVSQRSYSIKKLEPLYMPAREAAVTNAADSIVVYHQVVAAHIEGREDRAAALLAEIADYNLDDCVSTLRLRNWLLSRIPADERGLTPVGGEMVPPAPVSEQRATAMRLEALVRGRIAGVKPHERSPEQQALALVAASVLFHAREDKPIWQAHFERLRTTTAEWRGTDGVFLVESAEVKEAWHRDTPRQRPRRTLLLSGEPMRGVPLGTTSEVSAVYVDPAPHGIEALPGHANARSSASVRVLEAHDSLSANGRLHQRLLVEELQPKDGSDHDVRPIALVPGGVVNTRPIDLALAEVAQAVVDTPDGLPSGAGLDILLRRTPRLRGGAPLAAVRSGAERHIHAIIDSLLATDDSYVAVQGPPGTGKTFVGSRVIARLVLDHGWRVGVTSQGHKAVENVLRAVVAAGVPAEQVAKATKDTPDPPWTSLAHADELAAFSAEHRTHQRGYVIGGTAWDLTNTKRVGRGALDLVVIDEAGQFSLAKTLACAVAGDRLLLLGDPQQLPQVSTGTHADPVDTSALGWLIGDEPVLPGRLGYFLETTWRLHPALTAPVSVLAYAGRLESEVAVTASRALEGVEPGVHLRLVDHHDNSTWSPEEGEEVLSIIRDLLGRTWRAGPTLGGDGPGECRPLEASDLLVITPYNAQVGLLRRMLADAALDDVPVGTVDKFQGQEAPVVIVSMAASSPTDVSRGMSFLLDRHRINVAISRGQVAAYLVRSRVLTDFSPRTPEELVALGAFLGLCDGAVPDGPSTTGASPDPP